MFDVHEIVLHSISFVSIFLLVLLEKTDTQISFFVLVPFVVSRMWLITFFKYILPRKSSRTDEIRFPRKSRAVLSEDLTIAPLQCHLRRKTTYELKIGEKEKRRNKGMNKKQPDSGIHNTCISIHHPYMWQVSTL